MISNLINSVFGSRSDREIKLLYPIVDEINQLAEKLKNKSDEELKPVSYTHLTLPTICSV